MITGATFEDTVCARFSYIEGYLHLKAAFQQMVSFIKGHLSLTVNYIVETNVGCKDDTDSVLGRNKNFQVDIC